MAQLTESLKVEIVQRLAQYQPPAEISRALKDEYGINVIVQQIVTYDPSKPAYEAGERFVAIFNATREKFLKDVDAVPIANAAYRLNVLQNLLEHHLKYKKLPEAARVVEQAAKEVGGLYTNQTTLRTPDMAKPERAETDEERKAKLIGLIDGALGHLQPNAPGSDARQ